jgi:hypothetical protein
MMWKVRASKWSLATAVALLSMSALASASCGRAARLHPAAFRTAQFDSGIIGRVVIGPTCPVERPGKTCERPYQATIVIRREATHRLVARVQSSALGRFRVALAPGTYLLVPQNSRPYPRSSPRVVMVRRHRYATVLISYDSGIR